MIRSSHDAGDPGSPGNPRDNPQGDPAAPVPGKESGIPADVLGAPDATLGGYFATHNRPPAFQGSDGHPYTVSIESEKSPDLRAPYRGYLVFPRWALTGVGIVGHVETRLLWNGTTSAEVESAAAALTLEQVQGLLEAAIRQQDVSEDNQDRESEHA